MLRMLNLMALSIFILVLSQNASAGVEKTEGGQLPKQKVEILSSKQIQDLVAPSVVILNVLNDSGQKIVEASGFIISSTGIIVTCSHVIQDAFEVEIILHNGDKVKAEGLLYKEPLFDIALVKIPGAMYPFLKIAPEIPKMGTKIYSYGNSAGTGLTISEGLISSDYDSTTKLLKFNAPVSPGNSGGPLIEENGEVVGIVSQQLVGGVPNSLQLINYAYTSTLLATIDLNTLKLKSLQEEATQEDDKDTIIMIMPFDTRLFPNFLVKDTSDYHDFMKAFWEKTQTHIKEGWASDDPSLKFVDYENGLGAIRQSSDIYTSSDSDNNIRKATKADYLIEGSLGLDFEQSSKMVTKGLIFSMWKIENKYNHDDSMTIMVWNQKENKYIRLQHLTNNNEFYWTIFKYDASIYSESTACNKAIVDSENQLGNQMRAEYLNGLEKMIHEIIITKGND